MLIRGNRFLTLTWSSVKMSQRPLRPLRRQRPFAPLPPGKPRPIKQLSLVKQKLSMPLVSGRQSQLHLHHCRGGELLLYGYQEGSVLWCQTGPLHPTVACQEHATSGDGSHWKRRGETTSPSSPPVEQPYRPSPWSPWSADDPLPPAHGMHLWLPY